MALSFPLVLLGPEAKEARDFSAPLIKHIVAELSNYPREARALALAALLDLQASINFACYNADKQWYLCSEHYTAFRPYLESCPLCASTGTFQTVKGAKPTSAEIGKLAHYLIAILWEVLKATGNGQAQILYDCADEIDMAIVDEVASVIFTAEVKCGSLITAPILVADVHGLSRREAGHAAVEHREFSTQQHYLAFPRAGQGGLFTLPIISPIEGVVQEAMELALIDHFRGNPDALTEYFDVWRGLWELRVSGNRSDPAFFQVNGCGKIPNELSKSGKKEIKPSDGKTTVGLGRTDDLKKGLSQLTATKRAAAPATDDSNYEVLCGFVSNLPPLDRHKKYIDDIAATRVFTGVQTEATCDAVLSLPEIRTDESYLADLFGWQNQVSLRDSNTQSFASMRAHQTTIWKEHLLEELDAARRVKSILYTASIPGELRLYLSPGQDRRECKTKAALRGALYQWLVAENISPTTKLSRPVETTSTNLSSDAILSLRIAPEHAQNGPIENGTDRS